MLRRKGCQMSLISCRACQAEIAKTASTCPRCGAATASYHASLVGLFGMVGGFVLSAFASAITSDQGGPTIATATLSILSLLSMGGGVGYWVWRRFT